MAADTNWAPAYNITVTHGGNTLLVTTGEHSVEEEQFETTNAESDGAYEYGVGVTTHRIRYTIPLDADDPFIPPSRTLLDATWEDDEGTFTGKARVVRSSRRGGGRGGFTVDQELAFTGPVVKS